ncbi:MAG: HPr kinase/phosphatase C-terminal domain-containing protein [Sneathiella sp.]|nr:HPr kinase/phosphatase C-terminal domain-containing protein [Sneathiella sp.]
MIKVHASVVAINGQAVMLRGPSGSGKSDLSLRLIDEGAELVSDDYVELYPQKSHIIVKAPPPIQGLMEVRGLGLMKLPFRPNAPLSIVFDLVLQKNIDRLPARDTLFFADGIGVPLLRIEGLAPSSPAKIRIALANLKDIG